MKAEKEETTCLLDIAGKGSVKTSVQVPVKGITDRSPVHKPVKRVLGEKEAATWMEERSLSM